MLRTISARALFAQNKYVLSFFLYLPQLAQCQMISLTVKKKYILRTRGKGFNYDKEGSPYLLAEEENKADH